MYNLLVYFLRLGKNKRHSSLSLSETDHLHLTAAAPQICSNKRLPTFQQLWSFTVFRGADLIFTSFTALTTSAD